MLTTFLTVFEQMIRIIFLLSLGFMFNKLHLIPKAAEAVLSKFITMLFLPCLVLNAYIVECDFANLINYLPWVLYGLVYTLVGIGMSYVIARFFSGGDAYTGGVYRYTLAMPNVGAGATPLLIALFGTKGIFLGQTFGFAQSIGTYTWGIMQLQPAHGRHDLKFYLKRILNLNSITLVLGIVLGLLGAKEWIPDIILQTFADLGDGYVPVALLLAGFTIADYPVLELIGNAKIYLFSLVRLILIPGLFLLMVWLLQPVLGMSAMLCMIFVLNTSCPAGMNSVVFPAAYGQDCRPGASMVLVSTVLSVATMPVMYTLVTMLCGAPTA